MQQDFQNRNRPSPIREENADFCYAFYEFFMVLNMTPKVPISFWNSFFANSGKTGKTFVFCDWFYFFEIVTFIEFSLNYVINIGRQVFPLVSLWEISITDLIVMKQIGYLWFPQLCYAEIWHGCIYTYSVQFNFLLGTIELAD